MFPFNKFPCSNMHNLNLQWIIEQIQTNENDIDALEELLAVKRPNITLVNVLDYGAAGDNLTDDSEAFTNAVSALENDGGGVLLIPYGTYRLGAETIELIDNITVVNQGIINNNNSDTILFRAQNKKNVIFYGGEVSGLGVSGAGWLFNYDTCENSAIVGVKMRDGSSSSVRFTSCSNCLIEKCDIQNSYFYSIEDKLGVGNRFMNNILSNNGYGASTTGRGITVWMCDGAIIDGNVVECNNEYGIRTFTDASDTQDTKNIIISNNIVRDNATIDIHIYGTPKNVIVADNVIERSEDTNNTAINVSGEGHIIKSNIITKPAGSNGVSFVMYDASNCTISDCEIKGYEQGFSWSPTAKCYDCTVQNVNAVDIETFMPALYGGNITIADCNAKRVTSPAAEFTDYGIGQSDSEEGCIIKGNRLDGFNIGIILNNNVDLVLQNNVVRNSINSAIRSGLTDFHNIEMTGNDFEGGAYTGLQYLGRMECKAGLYNFYSNSDPATAYSASTFVQGDRAYTQSPGAGGSVGWVCVTGGTPGTWKTFGSISA